MSENDIAELYEKYGRLESKVEALDMGIQRNSQETQTELHRLSGKVDNILDKIEQARGVMIFVRHFRVHLAVFAMGIVVTKVIDYLMQLGVITL